MSARDELVNVFTDAGHKEFGQASEKATALYARIRREVLDDLARSGVGLLELRAAMGDGAELAGDPVMSRDDANDLWHRIRGAALLQAAERLADTASMAKHPKIRFALEYAAQTVHKMIINPGGTQNGEAQRREEADRDSGIVRPGDADGLGVGGA